MKTIERIDTRKKNTINIVHTLVGHFTEHAIVQLVEQIRNSFETKQVLGVLFYTFRCFIFLLTFPKQLIIKF